MKIKFITFHFGGDIYLMWLNKIKKKVVIVTNCEKGRENKQNKTKKKNSIDQIQRNKKKYKKWVFCSKWMKIWKRKSIHKCM